MIITRIKVENWRGLQITELHLSPRLNILGDDNEAGKSSVVEAIGKALCWDMTARKSSADNLESIIPANNPTARPTVTLDLQFDNLTATLTKVVAENKKHRECHLVVIQNGKQTAWKDDEAEKQLIELVCGYRESKALHCSEQSQPFQYLLDALPSAACAALSVTDAGAILPSKQLERVRLQIDDERSSKLAKKIKFPLRDSAKAGTPAYIGREELAAKTQTLQKIRATRDQVDQLRRDLSILERDVAAARPQILAERERLKNLRDRRRIQDQVKNDLLAKTQYLNQTRRDLREREGKKDQIAGFRTAIEQYQSSGKDQEKLLENHKWSQAELKKVLTAANQGKAGAEALCEDARRRQHAFEARVDLVGLEEKLRQSRQSQQRLDKCRQDLDKAEQNLRSQGIWPTGEQIGQWRRWHNDLIALNTEAGSKLQIDLKLLRPCRIEWWADGDSRPVQAIGPDQTAIFNSVRSLRLVIDDVGEIQVRCGADELVKLLDKIKRQTKKIDDAISGFGGRAKELPGGFDRLEELRIAGENGRRQVDEARLAQSECESELGTLAAVQQTVAELELLHAGGKLRYEPLRQFVSDNLVADELATELDKQRQRVRDCDKDRKDWDQRWQTHSEEKNRLDLEMATCAASANQERNKLKEAMQQLECLLADGLTDDQRQQEIANDRLEEARLSAAVQATAAESAKLGIPVTDEELKSLEENLQSQEETINRKQSDLGTKRTELKMYCGVDPQGQIDELEEEIRELEVKLQAEEIKLGGIILLDAILNAERQRLGQMISQPLNQRIGPWLSQIRNLPTKVVLDEAGGMISHIVTEQNGRSMQLPFKDLSGGLKGQIALLVRLTLARAMAQQRGVRELVILDDPLTETSPRRRPEMLRILQQAAEDVQILFVTCHEDTLMGLPGEFNRLSVKGSIPLAVIS